MTTWPTIEAYRVVTASAGIMPNATPVATAITAMITAGVTERELLAAVASRFPELTRAEFVASLHDATAAAKRRAARKH